MGANGAGRGGLDSRVTAGRRDLGEESAVRSPHDVELGLFFGDASQFQAQLLDSAVVIVFGFVMAYAWFKFSNLITPLRVSKEVELEGLDGPEMGCIGYPDFVLQGHRTDA